MSASPGGHGLAVSGLMVLWPLALGSVATLLAGALAYGAAPRQLLWPAREGASPLWRFYLIGALLCLVAAFVVLIVVRGIATAIFMIVTLLMAEWSLLPALLGLLRYRESPR